MRLCYTALECRNKVDVLFEQLTQGDLRNWKVEDWMLKQQKNKIQFHPS